MNNRRKWSHLGPVIPLFSPSAFLWHQSDLLKPFLTVLDKGMQIHQGKVINTLNSSPQSYFSPKRDYLLFPELFLKSCPLFLYCTEPDERRHQWLLVVFVGHVFLDSLSPCGPHWPAFKNTLLSLGRGNDQKEEARRGSCTCHNTVLPRSTTTQRGY